MTQDFSPDDDLDLFRQAVQGAKRLKHDQAEVGKAPRDRASIAGWFRLNNTTADYLDPPR